MKKYVLGFLMIALLSGGAIWVSAQASGEVASTDRDQDRRAQFIERIFNRVADELQLSDAQRTEARGISESSRTRVEPLIQQLKQVHEATAELGKDGTFNEARVEELAAQQANVMKQLMFEKERTKAQLFAVLTPEQRTRAAELIERFQNRGRHHFGRGIKFGF